MLPIWRKILWIMLPIAIGGIASILIFRTNQALSKVVLSADLSMLIFLVGAITSLLVAMVVLVSVISQQKNAATLEMALNERDESHRRFIRRLDHEIKNPLTALRTALVNLRESSTGQERQHAEQNAQLAVERLSHLLGDLRKLAELQERLFERLPVDIPELLEEMVEAARALPSNQSRKIHLVVSRVPWPLPSVTGDRDLLGLAIYNLVDNALKFTQAIDTIEVRAFEDGHSVVVEVADSGPGIPAEEADRIFEELFRGANAHGIEGSGLGLALAHRIVTLHSGQIALRSRQQGAHGTIFTMRLPVTAP